MMHICKALAGLFVYGCLSLLCVHKHIPFQRILPLCWQPMAPIATIQEKYYTATILC